MTFRIEQKILISKDSGISVNNFIKKNKAKILYKDRIVESIYFDNKNFQMFKDSEEGTVPRKKLRLRQYSNEIKKKIEKKVSSVEGRFKESSEISEDTFLNYIKSGIYDKDYGYCYPIVKISYLRSYFQVFSKRITIDREIKFHDYRFKNIYKIDQSILEIKTNINDNLDNLNFFFPFRKSRFSKYSEAIKTLKIKV